MPYYQRIGHQDEEQIVYGMGRFLKHPYRSINGPYTNIFDIDFNKDGGAKNPFFHGMIFDPSELGISPPFPERVTVDGIIYKYNPNDIPYNVNAPFNANSESFNGPRSLSKMPSGIVKTDRNEIIKNRSMQGVGHNQTMFGVNPGIYREKDQPEDKFSPTNQPMFEQSSMISQQLRRNIISGERMIDTLNMATGEISHCNGSAFFGDVVENHTGNKNTFFLNPANRPEDGNHKSLRSNTHT